MYKNARKASSDGAAPQLSLITMKLRAVYNARRGQAGSHSCSRGVSGLADNGHYQQQACQQSMPYNT
jgi:hypothetical protein